MFSLNALTSKLHSTVDQLAKTATTIDGIVNQIEAKVNETKAKVAASPKAEVAKLKSEQLLRQVKAKVSDVGHAIPETVGTVAGTAVKTVTTVGTDIHKGFQKAISK